MSETLALLGAALALLLAYRFWAQPSLGGAVAVAIVCGLLALTHPELVLLVLALLAPLILLVRDLSWKRRPGWLAIAIITTAAVIAPWAAYNAARFDEPVLLTHTLGYNLSSANCEITYSGERLGFVDERCLEMRKPRRRSTPVDASTRDAEQRRDGLDYARDHIARVPVVVLARVGRAWGMFRPFQQMTLEPTRGTGRTVTQLGFVAFWVLVPMAVFGAVVLRRRKVPLFPLLAFVVVATVGIALTFGYTRYRAPAEVSIVLLAAAGIDAILQRQRASAPASGSRPAAAKLSR